MNGYNGANVSWEEMLAHRNNCSSDRCIKCAHAEMLQVERSSFHVSCGCPNGRHFGTWSFWSGYTRQPPEECGDYVEVADDARKRMVNLAWELSCDRKGEWLECHGSCQSNSRPVYIGHCQPHNGLPFPEVNHQPLHGKAEQGDENEAGNS